MRLDNTDITPLDHIYAPLSSLNHYTGLAQLSMLFCIFCSCIFALSNDACAKVLAFLRLLVNQVAANFPAAASDPEILSTINQIPASINTALSRFSINGKTVQFARCRRCNALYPPEYREGSKEPLYPDICNNIPDGPELDHKELCSEYLFETVFDGTENAKVWSSTFLYFSFKDYVAALLSNPHIEKMARDACDKALRTIPNTSATGDPPPLNNLEDVFDGQFVRTFKGPDGKLFIGSSDELRLLFGLNVDFFNSNMLLERGSKTSCGIIAMICLNLPAHIRISKENIYLAGIIPGPKTPHLTELNHYLQPLIDELLESWTKGVYYSRTALHPEGRTVRSALALVCNDLPGARKAAQLADHSSHWFCTVCNLYHREALREGIIIHDTNYSSWPSKDDALLREAATAWKNAKCSKERDYIFKTYGTRWSPLWLLPYWEPSKQLVVDPMHNLLEGAVHNHFRKVLKLTHSDAKESVNHGKVAPSFAHGLTIPERSIGQTIHPMTSSLREKIFLCLSAMAESCNDPLFRCDMVPLECVQSLERKLSTATKAALRFVAEYCVDHDLLQVESKTKKQELVAILVSWVMLAISFSISHK
jgi:hypothetical protein